MTLKLVVNEVCSQREASDLKIDKFIKKIEKDLELIKNGGQQEDNDIQENTDILSEDCRDPEGEINQSRMFLKDPSKNSSVMKRGMRESKETQCDN